MAKKRHGNVRYFVEKGIPEQFAIPVTARLTYSRHAHTRYASRVLRHAGLNPALPTSPPRELDPSVAQLLAVDVFEDVLLEQLWSLPLDDERNLILVLNAEGRVVTLWVARFDDAFPLRKPSGQHASSTAGAEAGGAAETLPALTRVDSPGELLVRSVTGLLDELERVPRRKPVRPVGAPATSVPARAVPGLIERDASE
jgi:hypothetical protein